MFIFFDRFFFVLPSVDHASKCRGNWRAAVRALVAEIGYQPVRLVGCHHAIA